MPAFLGNDNIEIFSRVKIFNNLKRKNNKIVI